MAAGTVAYTDTTGNRDYLGIIASQIGRRLKEASDMASDERDFAEMKAELGGTSLDEAGVGKGYFFKRALGSRFGGDKIARTRGRMGARGVGTSPTGNYKTRFRGGFDYNVTNQIQASTLPLSSALSAGLSGVEGGLVSISQSLGDLARGMDGLARSQENAARQAVMNGAFMQAFLNHMQREGARQRARSEESGLEGGRRRFRGFGGGMGGGRGMINVTPPGGSGGGSGSGTGGATSFLTSQLLGKRTATVNKIAQSSPKVAKALGYPSKGPRITGTPALPAAGQSTATALTKSSDQAAIKLAGNRTIQKAFGRLGVTGTPQLIKNAQNVGKTSLAAVKTGGAALMEKSVGLASKLRTLVEGPDYFTDTLKSLPSDFFLDDPTDIMMANMGKNVDAIDAFASSRAGMVGKGQSEVMDAIIKNLDVESADDAVKLYSKLRSGTSKDLGYKVFSEAEADKVLQGILGEQKFAEWARTAKKPYKAAAKKTIAKKMLGKTDDVAKIGAKGATKLGAKAIGRSILKKLPVIAGLAGIYFGIERAMKGDLLGAGLEITSGLLGATGVGGSAGLVIDGYLLGRDMGMMPMAKGGFLTKPTPVVAGEAGAEGFFPLEGARGKKTFQMFGEGVLNAQKDNKTDVAELYALGNKKYYEGMNGWKAFGEAFKGIFSGLRLPDNPLQGIRNALGLGNNNVTPTTRSNYNFGYNLPPTGTLGTGEQNYGYNRGSHIHAGQDFDIAGPDATFESQIGGKVMRIQKQNGGYGNYIDIYNKDMDVTERIAEGAEVLVKVGDVITPGTPVTRGETDTGVIHYEIRKGKEETYGFEGTLNPMEFLESHTVHSARDGRPANAPANTNITPNQVIEVPNDAGFTLQNFSSSSNPDGAASILNGQSGMFSMGSQFMMAPTIINNYNTVAGGSGNDDSFGGGFPSFAQGFIVPYSMDALK